MIDRLLYNIFSTFTSFPHNASYFNHIHVQSQSRYKMVNREFSLKVFSYRAQFALLGVHLKPVQAGSAFLLVPRLKQDTDRSCLSLMIVMGKKSLLFFRVHAAHCCWGFWVTRCTVSEQSVCAWCLKIGISGCQMLC